MVKAGNRLSFDERPHRTRRLIVEIWRRLTAAASSGAPSSILSAVSRSTSRETISEGHQPVQPGSPQQSVDLLVEDNDFSADDAHHSRSEDARSTTHSARDLGQDGPASSEPPLHYGFAWLRWHLEHFFFLRFENPEHEDLFQKERWYNSKGLGICLSLFLVLNWILYLSINLPLNTFDMHSTYSTVTYYGLAPAFTVPLVFLVAWDIPVTYYWPFQIYFACSLWLWGIGEIVQARQCGFFSTESHAGANCDNKDFLALMFYSSALPLMGLYGASELIQRMLFAQPL